MAALFTPNQPSVSPAISNSGWLQHALVHSPGYVILDVALCWSSIRWAPWEKMNTLKARCNSLSGPLIFSFKWQFFFVSAPKMTSSVSTKIHFSCSSDSWTESISWGFTAALRLRLFLFMEALMEKEQFFCICGFWGNRNERRTTDFNKHSIFAIFLKLTSANRIRG